LTMKTSTSFNTVLGISLLALTVSSVAVPTKSICYQNASTYMLLK
jgi:hypothetical protein